MSGQQQQQQQQQQKKGWGSLLAGTLSSLESRLDNILIDDETAQAAAQARAQAKSTSTTTTTGTSNTNTNTTPRADATRLAVNGSAAGSRDASRSRVNDRLAERLAKATAQKSSRPTTPANDDHTRGSVDSRRSNDTSVSVPDIAASVDNATPLEPTATSQQHGDSEKLERSQDSPAQPAENVPLASSTLPINPARVSIDNETGASEPASAQPVVHAPDGVDIPSGPASDGHSAGQQASTNVASHAQSQQDIQAYMERIDALQVKLTYLAKETVAAAKKANASSEASTLERQLASKDEKIALLMEEGEKLSKSELRHLQNIKRLRSKAEEDEKSCADLKRRLERAETSEADLKARLRIAEVAERQASDKMKQIALIERQVEELRTDRENAAELIRNLTTQLKDSNERAVLAEKNATIKASEVDKGKIAHLQNELEDAQIEKKLAEDRAASEVKKLREEAQRQKERYNIRELEFKSELSALESRLEAMRARAEEASTTGGAGDSDGHIKLMRQVEILQQQYGQAKGNWETIEGSLNARIASLERERDEASKREADVRKRARDASMRSRRAEEELEAATDRIQGLTTEIESQQARINLLESSLKQTELSLADAKGSLDRQRKQMESEVATRVEEEKLKVRREMQYSPHLASLQSPTTSSASRKSPAVDLPMMRGKGLTRLASHDLSSLHFDQQRTSNAARRTSALPNSTSNSTRGGLGTPTEASPSISRRESMLSLQPGDMPPTPSIEVPDRLSEAGGSSPQRTIADLMSNSTAGPGAGPSVQLVERMSSLVRKLESEKASFKDELARLQQQRDSARDEVVELMREIETKRSSQAQSDESKSELNTLKKRYDASLEMLGEREEEVEELKADVVELKRIYKELLESKLGAN